MNTPCKEPRRALVSKEYRMIPRLTAPAVPFAPIQAILSGRYEWVIRLRCGGHTVCPRFSYVAFEDAARAVLNWIDRGVQPDDPDDAIALDIAQAAAQSKTAEGYGL